MVGWDIGRAVEVKEGVTDGILERMMDGAAARVPDDAFVEGDMVMFCGGAWVRNEAEEEEESVKGGGYKSGDN